MSGRSHPPSLLRSAERTIVDFRLVEPGDTVLAACSGGPDSTALLDVLARLRTTLGFELVAHGVDHGLRAEASAELAAVADIARRIGVPFTMSSVAVEPGSNLQARARALRLKALSTAALSIGARSIATGHTLDDRAETLLLRLLRGAGPRGLAVLPPAARLPSGSSAASGPDDPPSSKRSASTTIRLIRPLIAARREAVDAHVRRHRLAVATDPSNADPRFLRVRVRAELVPLLEDLSPRIVEHLGALADMLGGRVEEHAELLHTLGRAQRQAIERARRLGQPSVRLRLQGGRDVEVHFPNGEIVVIEEG